MIYKLNMQSVHVLCATGSPWWAQYWTFFFSFWIFFRSSLLSFGRCCLFAIFHKIFWYIVVGVFVLFLSFLHSMESVLMSTLRHTHSRTHTRKNMEYFRSKLKSMCALEIYNNSKVWHRMRKVWFKKPKENFVSKSLYRPTFSMHLECCVCILM